MAIVEGTTGLILLLKRWNDFEVKQHLINNQNHKRCCQPYYCFSTFCHIFISPQSIDCFFDTPRFGLVGCHSGLINRLHQINFFRCWKPNRNWYGPSTAPREFDVVLNFKNPFHQKNQLYKFSPRPISLNIYVYHAIFATFLSGSYVIIFLILPLYLHTRFNFSAWISSWLLIFPVTRLPSCLMYFLNVAMTFLGPLEFSTPLTV